MIVPNDYTSLSDHAVNPFSRKARKSHFMVDENTFIGPGERLTAESDLGDIDVLAIDMNRKHIYSIECKKIHCGRNPREMANEIERIEGEREDSKSWINKHLRRDTWLKTNASKLGSVLGLTLADYKISSVFLTSEDIPATYLRSLKLPFISFPKLRRGGISALSEMNT